MTVAVAEECVQVDPFMRVGGRLKLMPNLFGNCRAPARINYTCRQTEKEHSNHGDLFFLGGGGGVCGWEWGVTS
jgi:hypothetical protein